MWCILRTRDVSWDKEFSSGFVREFVYHSSCHLDARRFTLGVLSIKCAYSAYIAYTLWNLWYWMDTWHALNWAFLVLLMALMNRIHLLKQKKCAVACQPAASIHLYHNNRILVYWKHFLNGVAEPFDAVWILTDFSYFSKSQKFPSDAENSKLRVNQLGEIIYPSKFRKARSQHERNGTDTGSD